MYDFAAGLTHFPYTIERGVRFPDEPSLISRSPINTQVIETRAPVLINDVPAAEREGGEAFPVQQGEPALSVARSSAHLRRRDPRPDLVAESRTERMRSPRTTFALLATLAGSLSVALENARLIHETRQRNVELALINSVQAAVAAELDPQAIYEVVGDKIEEVYDAQAVSISTFDEATGSSTSRTWSSAASAS